MTRYSFHIGQLYEPRSLTCFLLVLVSHAWKPKPVVKLRHEESLEQLWEKPVEQCQVFQSKWPNRAFQNYNLYLNNPSSGDRRVR